MATPKKGKLHGGTIGRIDVHSNVSNQLKHIQLVSVTLSNIMARIQFHVIDTRLPETLLNKVASALGKDWKRLGRDMELKDYEIDSIEMDHNSGGVYEMAYQMLRSWRQKLGEKANVRALEQHLEAIGRRDIATTVSKTTTPLLCGDITSEKGKPTVCPYSDLLSEVRDKLMEEYQKIEMTGLPWMPGLAFTLDEYYVDLSLITVDNRGRELNSRSIIVNDVLNPTSSTKKLSRILVEGDPGMGKSTFTAKIAHDWANQKDYVKHFDLVVLISLRHFNGELKDAIFSASKVKETYYAHVLKVFEDTSKQVLFVMDGYDEVSPEMETVILPILQQEVYCHTTVIVTSRPGKFPTHNEEADETRCQSNVDFSSTGSHFIQKRIKIKGFTKEQQILFVKRHTQNCSEEKARSIMLKLDTMVDKDFLKCPLFLLMLIVMLVENDGRESLSKSKTDLYKQLFNFVLRRYWSRKNHAAVSEIDLFSCTTMCDSNLPHILPMLQFFRFSVWALSSYRVSFRHDEIVNLCRGHPFFLELGFLTQSVILQISPEISVVYEPVHKSLLEFAIAYGFWLILVGRRGAQQVWQNDCTSFGTDEGEGDRFAAYFFQQMSKNSQLFQFFIGLWLKTLPNTSLLKKNPALVRWMFKIAKMFRIFNKRAFDVVVEYTNDSMTDQLHPTYHTNGNGNNARNIKYVVSGIDAVFPSMCRRYSM